MFKFELGENVRIVVSGDVNIGDEAKIIGRAEHLDTSDQYRLEYVSKDGIARECWWSERQLQPITSNQSQ